MSKRSYKDLVYGVLAFAIPACNMHTAVGAESSSPTAIEYVDVSFEHACDVNNKLLVLKNRHDFKTIVVTIRWSAWKGETLTQDVFAMPKTVTEIGCATDGEILRAAFTEF